MPKIVVIGLDGATWDLIKPWAEKGELPTFKKLLEKGTWGYLESTIPPVTGPAWTSFSTGKNPGKHGIFDFVYLKDGRLKLHTSKDIKTTPFYELLSKAGKKSVIISLPLSFPPSHNFRGVMVSDFLYHNIDIYPLTKRKYLTNYRVIYDVSKKGHGLLLDIIDTAEKRIQLAKELFLKEKWDFYYLWFGETDSISHTFWKHIKRDDTIGKTAKRVFQIADEFLSWLLNRLDKDTILFLVSDHGFGDYPYTVYLNRLLETNGYLHFAIKKVGTDERISVHTESKYFKVPKIIFKLATHPLILPISRGLHKLLFKGKQLEFIKYVNFQNSKAFLPTVESMGIYINLVDPAEKEKIKNELIEILNNLEHNGIKVFKRIMKKSEVYWGDFVDDAPDILFLTNGFLANPAYSDKIFERFQAGSYHELFGIFLAYGSEIKKGQRVDAKIYDIAPTILHIFGLPIPNDMDGRVLIEIFEDSSEFAKRKPRYVDPNYYETKGEDEKLKKAIKNLELKGKI